MMRAQFITVEGLDGAGKSTHLAWLADHLQERGVKLCVTREPGGTQLGETLRALLLDRDQRLDAETEAMLMFAARREHIAKVIKPALTRGEWVLSDRFTDASYAYQSGGSGVAWQKVEVLESWVQGDLRPDITIYFDVTPEVGRQRTGAIKSLDRFEQEHEAFHVRVREAYLRRARECSARMRIVDANRPLTEVQNELGTIVAGLFTS
jgi:dTMP kinase